jgi:hypothetical protein
MSPHIGAGAITEKDRLPAALEGRLEGDKKLISAAIDSGIITTSCINLIFRTQQCRTFYETNTLLRLIF